MNPELNYAASGNGAIASLFASAAQWPAAAEFHC